MNECSACHVDYYYNPDVRVLFSSQCDHRVCERCISRLYKPGPYKCPACDRQLIAEDFSVEPREAKQVETEVKVRKQIMQVYCKNETDFQTKEEYDNYLDLREDLIYRVVFPSSQEDVQEVWRIVETCKEANADQIRKTQRLAPRRKLQKIINIINEEASFYTNVNSEWGEEGKNADDVTQHPFKQQYAAMLENPPADCSRPNSAISSPPATPINAHGPQNISRHMNGGGYQHDAVIQKARHFFFADLATFATNETLAQHLLTS